MSYKSSIPSQSIEDILKRIDGAIVLDPTILSLTSSSTSTTISNAVGGPSGFTDILNSLRGGKITFGIIKDDYFGKGFVQANMYADSTQNKLTIAWLDSLVPKEIVIEMNGTAFTATLNWRNTPTIVNLKSSNSWSGDFLILGECQESQFRIITQYGDYYYTHTVCEDTVHVTTIKIPIHIDYPETIPAYIEISVRVSAMGTPPNQKYINKFNIKIVEV